MSAAGLWYVPHKPDLLLLAPCDGEGPMPCPGSMFVSIDHLHDAPADARAAPPAAPANADSSPATTTAGTSTSATADAASGASTTSGLTSGDGKAKRPGAKVEKWRHPQATAFLTAFGDIAKQQPRVVRCACGSSPCTLRGLSERGGVPDELIPKDWAEKWELPGQGEDSPAPPAPEGRRAAAVQLWLDCTARAEKELPRPVGQEAPPEEEVLKAAQAMLTDYLKGRVCFQCNVPSSRMQKCGRCAQARYCSRECQRAHWPAHKAECAAAATAAKTTAATAAAAAVVARAEPKLAEGAPADPAPATAPGNAKEATAAPTASGDSKPAEEAAAAAAGPDALEGGATPAAATAEAAEAATKPADAA